MALDLKSKGKLPRRIVCLLLDDTMPPELLKDQFHADGRGRAERAKGILELVEQEIPQ